MSPIFSGVMREQQAEEMIEKIMDKFPFERVHSAMVALDWTWGGLFGASGDELQPGRVPSIDELKGTALELLQKVAVSCGGGYLSTGGFTASATPLGMSLQWGFDWSADRLVRVEKPAEIA